MHSQYFLVYTLTIIRKTIESSRGVVNTTLCKPASRCSPFFDLSRHCKLSKPTAEVPFKTRHFLNTFPHTFLYTSKLLEAYSSLEPVV